MPFNGARLRELRLRRALTLRELGALAGVSYDNIQAIEVGKQMPRPSTLRKLAAALGVAPEALFEPEPFEVASRRLHEQDDGFSNGRRRPPETAATEMEKG